ncbi:disease resistance protein RUN1-like, partial [Arachis duranensis]|uniref:ADP-ribosyl cyclase/cyclic ADP-ribose hydrolase n=1 Tax=Arachis duranensis TaxID=130453 RepID=A0A9C6T9Y6_ARADU
MSSSGRKHDVFLSFRGEDTRVGFTSHLHSALDRNQIDTYIDYNLRKGEQVWPKLSEAIEGSRLAIVVFSENYASSKWCMEELVKIMECRKLEGLVVIPVFYETDPSDVRNQTGTYDKALAKLERDLGSALRFKVHKWKAALTEAANLCGWDSRTHRDNSELIQNIVNDVLQKLYLRYPNEIERLIGNDKARTDIESLLEKVQVIGIWGMGGIGKTTIAKAVFAKHFPQHESSCFLANVREEWTKLGPTHLRDKLIYDILKEHIPSSNVVGSTFINRRVLSKKVLIVLDDVDSVEQLEYLCGDHGDLGPDSKLIITTRDRQMLVGRVDEIYELKGLNFQESLTLFSLNAFKVKYPEEGYKHLSERVVDYAGGVPLALKVLGSYLYKKSRVFWENALKKLRDYPNLKIQSVLKVSYDGLDELEKDIFLDIAFFFKGKDKDYVIKILDACGFYTALGIDVLVNKALLTVSYNNRLQMHDLLEEMGLDIVRHECEKDPGRCSRLRNIKEVYDVLKNNKGTDRIQGIALDLSEVQDLYLEADTFSMMINLRFLRFHLPSGRRSADVFHPRALKSFSEKLRYFEWHGYPFKSLPPNFCAKLLVEIRMPWSNVKELWQGIQDLVNLEGIDLSECKQLIKLPDLSRASKLKWVYLSGCENLCVVHPSVLSLDTLVTLILDGCKKLKSLKGEKHLASLEKISVNGCSSLREFSVSSDLIERLDLSNTGIQMLHSSIGHLHKLVWLNLEGLRLKNLPNELSSLRFLEELRISNCIQVIDKQKLHILCDGLESLKILHLKYCDKLSELPDNIDRLSKLNELRLDGSSVERLPTSIKNLQQLEILSLKNCRKLRFLAELPPFIKEFCADNCTSLVAVSTLASFAAKMKGKKKLISFKNCMKLDRRSHQRIIEAAQLIMMSASYYDVILRWYSADAQNYICNNVEVCLVGSNIPKQFKYRTTSSSIAILLPTQYNMPGFIYSLVLSPSHEMKKHGVKIQCQCYLADGKEIGNTSTWHYNAIRDLNSDHIFAWYDPLHWDSICR